MSDFDFNDSDDEAGSSSSGSGSRASFPAFTESVASSATSVTTVSTISSRTSSPAPSVFSVTSSLRANAYREEYGRALNNYSDVYRIAADHPELERLDQQHEMFKIVMGKYSHGINEVLEHEAFGNMKQCLDIGCGSGSWIVEVARDFPNCNCVAVDLVPIPADLEMPPNLRSEVDDVNLGLDHFFHEFDYVHTRLISSGIKDYKTLIEEIASILRPRGMIDLMEFDFRVYGADHAAIIPDTSIMQAPWLPRWMTFLNVAVRHLGGNIDAADLLDTWVGSNTAFESVVYREFYIPTSHWPRGDYPEAEHQRYIGSLMREDIKEFMLSTRPLLLGSGMPVYLLDVLEANCRAELNEAHTPHYIRVQNCYARRRRLPTDRT